MTSNLMHIVVVQLKMALRKRYEQCLLHLQSCGEGSVMEAHHKVP